ncbi:hypothetical protein GLAREA_13034 [Glarea lozoyensis ATCC 20868]|uniref:Uncharacterized protein n=1 Tax=Glarea lozoyensis (strain ATCC 20868 / MF5171) TaxID=1116229 RepID=S3DED8_GLAL2|nr:uncharacterized protein GLAREA_13034 [Glarea lozoyensis ATCC 20868]EPE30311.1 hypothetical protein GLAREA_13034 [Glarea lozoyensis ATCC 20868]
MVVVWKQAFLRHKEEFEPAHAELLLPGGVMGSFNFGIKNYSWWLQRNQDLGAIDTRAWTFQELLARNLIYFGDDDITYMCRNTSKGLIIDYDGVFTKRVERNDPELDCFATVTSHHLERSDFDSPATFTPQNWASLVEKYSARNLSNREDRLPALAGIAAKFAAAWPGDYKAGLWQRHLVRHLG